MFIFTHSRPGYEVSQSLIDFRTGIRNLVHRYIIYGGRIGSILVIIIIIYTQVYTVRYIMYPRAFVIIRTPISPRFIERNVLLFV